MSVFCLSLLVFFFSTALSDLHALTPANTLVQNRAHVQYEIGSDRFDTQSNLSGFRVLELLNHSLVSNHSSGLSVPSPSSDKALSFTLVNTGNGEDSYVLRPEQLAGDDFNVLSLNIYLDSNSDGIFNSSDSLYSEGVNDPILSQGESLNFFIVSDIPSSLSNDEEAVLRLTTRSVSGVGSLGDRLVGVGDGGVDAVVGSSEGSLFVDSMYYVAASSVLVNKSQVIVDPLGGANPISGAVITYTLEVQVSGSGQVTNAVLSDAIPANTTYVANSLRHNGVLLTDELDADIGFFNGSEVRVSLGTLDAPSVQTISFKVQI